MQENAYRSAPPERDEAEAPTALEAGLDAAAAASEAAERPRPDPVARRLLSGARGLAR
ncbi:hypothetical protein [Streptomyces tanashiensis]|uniref:Uncharacterized protein n=1 Tax=Streptomyces tanashiensis TaxID=67367 RepID=A0ABY6QQG4_9ACTN|nr:hypothetical protein [Streptomyces tanashiensis]UZX19338.1 hypothetical protein LDH80_00615 [Streptomyces tanashiensis]